MNTQRIVRTLVLSLSLVAAVVPRTAAAIDLTGTFTVEAVTYVGTFVTTWNVVQAGTSLTVTGEGATLTGTIDGTTRAFTLTGPQGGPPLYCAGSSYSGVAAVDGNGFTGTATSYVASVTHCQPFTSTFTGSRCGDGAVGPGEACDDGNTAGGDCCSPTCKAAPDGTACNDGNACTTGEACAAGTCGGGAETTCPACLTCDPTGGCVAAPRSGCRLPAVAHAGSVQLKDGPGTKDSLQWKWLRGEATALADFGDPTANAGYDLCIYDGTSNLLLHSAIPAGGTCAGKPCWKTAGSTGFAYTDKEASPDGIASVRLKAGDTGRASVIVKGTGANLQMPSFLGLTLPMRVQLQASDGACWETVSSEAQVDDVSRFKARSD